MKKEKILYLLICILPICKIIDVLLAQIYLIGKVSFEWDGVYYILSGFVNQNLFIKDKLALLSMVTMLLMTIFSILVKYKFIF